MKKIICFIVLVSLLILVLSSCKSEDLLKVDSPHLLQEACVFYSVPGYYTYDLKGVSVDVIETDDYGRTLLYFEGYNCLLNDNASVYVICQKCEDSTVYFYEDINYMWAENSDLDKLKEINDWNHELNTSKLSAREIRVSLDSCLLKRSALPDDYSGEKFYKSLNKLCGIQKDNVAFVEYCDSDGQAQDLCIIGLHNGEKYFCIRDNEYNVYVAKIDDTKNFVDTLRKLKSESGWHYISNDSYYS